MSISVSFSGQTFSLPSQAERNWADALNAYFIALAANSLPRAGGSFTLAADLDLGNTANLYVKGLVSKTAGPSATGYVRLANNEGLGWRNVAGTNDLILKVNTSDQLEYNGSPIAAAADVTSLTSRMTTAETEIDALQAADIVLQTNINGKEPTITQLPIAKGGTGQATAATAFAALSPLTTKGDLSTYSTTTARLGVGANGTVLTADSAQATGLTWSAPLTNPMTDVGDLIIGGASGAATRLAPNTTTTRKFLTQTGTGAAGQAQVWTDLAGTLPGQPSNAAIAAGYIGERLTNQNSGSVSGTPALISGNITLTPGIWLVYGNFGSANTATNTTVRAFLSTTGTAPVAGTTEGMTQDQLRATSGAYSGVVPQLYVNVNTNTNIGMYIAIDVTIVSFAAFITAIRIA